MTSRSSPALVLCALAFAALVVTLVRVRDTLSELRAEVDAMRRETAAAAAELQRRHRRRRRRDGATARADLERFDRVLGSAEAISDAVGQQPAARREPALSSAGDQGRRRRPPGTSAAPCGG